MADGQARQMMSEAGDEKDLFVRAQRGDGPAREELVTRYLALARRLAGRYRGRGELDDLNQVASVALLKAIDRFDPARGLAFSSFAVPTIVGELKRYFRDHGWAVRVPRDLKELKLRIDRITQVMTAELGRSPTAAELAVRAEATIEQVLEALAAGTAHYPDSLDQPVTEDGGTALEFLPARDDSGFEHVENTMIVDDLLARLPDRDRLILRLRFEQDLTQAEIGEQLGVSQMHVSRLIRRSIATLQASQSAKPAPPAQPRAPAPAFDPALADLLLDAPGADSP